MGNPQLITSFVPFVTNISCKEKWPEVEASGHGPQQSQKLVDVEFNDLNRVGWQLVSEVVRYVA